MSAVMRRVAALLAAAVAVLVVAAGPASAGGRPAPARWAPTVNAASAKSGVDRSVLTAQLWQESGFNPDAHSAYADGIAQFTPATARSRGVNASDPVASIYGMASLDRDLLDRYHGDTASALAAYNAGPGAVDRFGGVPPYRETQNYVRSIMGAAGEINNIRPQSIIRPIAASLHQGQTNSRPTILLTLLLLAFVLWRMARGSAGRRRSSGRWARTVNRPAVTAAVVGLALGFAALAHLWVPVLFALAVWLLPRMMKSGGGAHRAVHSARAALHRAHPRAVGAHSAGPRLHRPVPFEGRRRSGRRPTGPVAVDGAPRAAHRAGDRWRPLQGRPAWLRVPVHIVAAVLWAVRRLIVWLLRILFAWVPGFGDKHTVVHRIPGPAAGGTHPHPIPSMPSVPGGPHVPDLDGPGRPDHPGTDPGTGPTAPGGPMSTPTPTPDATPGGDITKYIEDLVGGLTTLRKHFEEDATVLGTHLRKDVLRLADVAEDLLARNFDRRVTTTIGGAASQASSASKRIQEALLEIGAALALAERQARETYAAIMATRVGSRPEAAA